MIKMSDSVGKIMPAFLKAQQGFSAAVKDSNNPYFKSKYADFNSVLDAVTGSLHENGIAFQQHPSSEEGKIGVVTILIHSSGEWISSEFTMPVPKLTFQEAGQGITYARRYSLQAICGIGAEDDDGNTIKDAEDRRSAKKPKPSIEAGGEQAFRVVSADGKNETVATMEKVEAVLMQFIKGTSTVESLRQYWVSNSTPLNHLKEFLPEGYKRVEAAFKEAAKKLEGEK